LVFASAGDALWLSFALGCCSMLVVGQLPAHLDVAVSARRRPD